MVYGLCTPYFKNYAYIIAIIPSLYIIAQCIPKGLPQILAVFMMCWNFYNYQQLTVILALYGYFVLFLIKGHQLCFDDC
jgi:hypothetical protein